MTQNLPDLIITPDGEVCAVCKQSTKQRCGGCESIAYCSGGHQEEHWNQHKTSCRAYKVLKNDKVGRYTVATRTLEPGEVVLEETAVIVGPKQDTVPICLGCYTPVDGSYLCSRCGWPVCDSDCENADCHQNYECKVFQDAGARFQGDNFTDITPAYECIAPLRLLLVKERAPERWAEVQEMQTHNDIRRETPTWLANQVNTVDYIRKICKLGDKFEDDAIHSICGILEVNAFEARGNGSSIRGIFPQTAIMSHSCVSNTIHSIYKNFRIVVRTTVRIEKGEEITTTYTHTLSPTLLRREHLKLSKFFDCTCDRCKDPTELGTHLSSIKCNKCDPGLVLPTDPLDASSVWKCSHCEFNTKGQAVQKVFSIIQAELDATDPSDVQEFERIFKKYKSVLHPRHAFMTAIRHSLAQLYGRVEEYMLNELPDILLERKIELCKQLLAVADVVEPGYSRLRGMTLYELHAPVLILARNLAQYKEIDMKTMRARFEEAAGYLREAATILKHEDPESPEGVIGLVAEHSLKQLEASIQTLPQ